MGLRMKKFDIFGVQKLIKRGDCLKGGEGGALTVSRFKGELGKKEGGGGVFVFQGRLIPQCTL